MKFQPLSHNAVYQLLHFFKHHSSIHLAPSSIITLKTNQNLLLFKNYDIRSDDELPTLETELIPQPKPSFSLARLLKKKCFSSQSKNFRENMKIISLSIETLIPFI